MITHDERHKQHVPEEENFLNMGSFEFLYFSASDTKLDRGAQLDSFITMLHRKVTWDVYCTCWVHAQNLQLFVFSRLELKPCNLHDSKFVSRQLFWGMGGACHYGYWWWAAQKARAGGG